MGKISTGVIAALCLAGGLMAPSNAWADDDEPDGGSLTRSMACVLTPLMQIRPALSLFQVELARPDQIPGLSLSFHEAEDWTEPVVNEYGTLTQTLPVGKGADASVSLQVYTAKNPKTLRAAFDYNHRQALSDAHDSEAGIVGTLVADNAEDDRGRPSWFVRTRAEVLGNGTLCNRTERTARNVLIVHAGKTYLVELWGYYSWDYGLSETDDPDPDIADEVADQVANGLAIDTIR